MRAKGGKGVGRFSVEFEVANYGDLTVMERGLMPPEKVRRETIRGLVDSGAAKLVLPRAVVDRLGLPLGGPVQVRYADGRRSRRREVKGVFLKLLGRDGTFTAICEPKRETALLGAEERVGAIMEIERLEVEIKKLSRRVSKLEARAEETAVGPPRSRQGRGPLPPAPSQKPAISEPLEDWPEIESIEFGIR